ncbi:unnamed protein product, partial [Discosporangium mesarthrocarpum]
MASRPLRRLGLDEDMVSRMAAAGLHTCNDLFSKTELQLVATLNLNREDVVQLLCYVATTLAPKTRVASDLLRERREGGSCFLATGLPTIDEALQASREHHDMGGGFPTGMITELVGPAGVGKTQTCLMMAAQACLPHNLGGLGTNTGVVYLDTERKFSPDRLMEIATSRTPEYYASNDEAHTSEGMTRLLAQVTVFSLDSSTDLLGRLESLQPLIIEGNKRLIILDSIAALARKVKRTLERGDVVNRQELLTRQAAVLKRLAYVFNAVVLVTNQVTTRFAPSNEPPQGGQQASVRSDDSFFQADVDGHVGSYIVPALGNTWHHCVSNRLLLEHHETHREIRLCKSPLAPSVACKYEVETAGL